MQPCLLAILWGGGKLFLGSGGFRALHLTVPLGGGSDNLGYGPGSGFNFKPVQTSSSLYPWWLIS